MAARTLLFLLCIIVHAVPLVLAKTPALPAEVEAAFSVAGIPADAIALVVERLDGTKPGQRLFAQNSDRPMNPASVMKLLTTSAALDLLGPAHTWETELRAASQPVDGVLRGPLYLKGGGDPKLTLERFWLLLRQLRLKGVRDIQGDLVLDRSLFALAAHDPGAFDNEPLRPYNAGADALLLNFNAIGLLLVPKATDKTVDALLETPNAALRLKNELRQAEGGCGDWREKISVTGEGSTIELAGPYPKSCGERRLAIAAPSGDVQVEGLFRGVWGELGGTLRGAVLSGVTPDDTLLLARLESLPLAEVVRDINKFSNNVMARQLYLALSSDTPPATYEKSSARLREWLNAKGIAAPELSVENGAGLSRRDRVSAETLAAVLRSAWQGPTMAELMASLPILGEDGTMKRRGRGKDLVNSNGRGLAHLKTGYLEGVRALAGYLLDRRGQRWLLVILVNHPNARQAAAGMDSLVDWVVRGR